jgi:hypothetical protein
MQLNICNNITLHGQLHVRLQGGMVFWGLGRGQIHSHTQSILKCQCLRFRWKRSYDNITFPGRRIGTL